MHRLHAERPGFEPFEVNSVASLSDADQQAPNSGGKVIVFLGAAGGVGTTTLCANVAQALGFRGRTLALDLALPLGGLSNLLSLPVQPSLKNLAEAVARPQPLDSRPEHSITGLSFRPLTGFGDPSLSGSPSAESGELLSIARAIADYILVDLGSAPGPYASSVVECANLAVVTLALERTQMAQARRLIRWLEGLGLGQNRRILVGNRLRPSPLGLREARRYLGETVFLIVPNESDRLASCLNEGRLLIAQHPGCAGAAAMAELAAAIWRDVTNMTSIPTAGT